MKKHNLSNFLKSKSFYVLLSVGTLAILVIAVLGVYQASKRDNNEFAELEGSKSEVVDEDNSNDKFKVDNDNKPPSQVTKNKDGNEGVDKAKNETKEPTDVVKVPDETSTDDKLLEFDEYNNQGTSEEVTKTVETEPVAKEVMKPTTLHFNHEQDKILWPVSGNVIRKYSMDKLVHYATLAQWKVSPAMLISAEEGEEVTCAADGIVTAIEENEEIGLTVTTSIGDGYNLVYAQLKDLTIKEGDSIEKGQIIGYVSKPTRFNSVEGPSLYFQLFKGEETLDPMLCLE
ncbi:MAG: M23 family metallopeptidase [Clostridiales bacterium]|nr:M23 family metallopeptidase [Clostridiales bacterium]